MHDVEELLVVLNVDLSETLDANSLFVVLSALEDYSVVQKIEQLRAVDFVEGNCGVEIGEVVVLEEEEDILSC